MKNTFFNSVPQNNDIMNFFSNQRNQYNSQNQQNPQNIRNPQNYGNFPNQQYTQNPRNFPVFQNTQDLQNLQNQKKLEEKLRIEQEREIKKQQEAKYAEMLEKNKKELAEKNKINKKIENLKKKKENLKKKFENRKTIETQNLINLAIRFPSGKRILEDFSKIEKSDEIYDFVFTQNLEDLGFEDFNNNFYIIMNSFPPKRIEKGVELVEFFGDSNQEAITVKEIFE